MQYIISLIFKGLQHLDISKRVSFGSVEPVSFNLCLKDSGSDNRWQMLEQKRETETEDDHFSTMDRDMWHGPFQNGLDW